MLFPARLVPPFDLFEGEAQLSKAYLARLRRIDEAAYGLAPRRLPWIRGRANRLQSLVRYPLWRNFLRL